MKAEEGLCTGQVLYHQHISKPAAEVVKKTRDIKDQEELREKRRKQQVICKVETVPLLPNTCCKRLRL